MTTPAPSAADALAFLDDEHPIFKQSKAAWEREERRLAGGDDVLSELVRFAGEETTSYEDRKKSAAYPKLPEQHAANVVGHIARQRPVPGKGIDFGALGKVRERTATEGTPDKAELLWYNVDGTGQDGSQWPAYFDAVQERALATGHRWILCEVPPLPTNADGTTRQPTEADEAAGFRPYAVEYSPLEVPYWHYLRGQLQFAIIRVTLPEVTLKNGTLSGPDKPGYYLLVREGYAGLGETFKVGGWWLYDSEKTLQRSGTWEKTRGQIPLFPFFGKMARGTKARPAISQSLTMELGQLAVAMMNAASAWYYDFWDACGSRLFFLGADPDAMNAAKTQNDARSIWIGVPPVANESGTGADRVVSIYDGSTGTVAADVAEKLLASLVEQARGIMLAQLTSTPESSGTSKQAGFAEASEPLLVRLAITREQAENTFLYFAALRWGVAPGGYVSYPREFDLLSVRESVDQLIGTLTASGLKSPTLTAKLLARAAEEDGLIEDKQEADTVLAELTESGADLRRTAKLTLLTEATAAGASLTGAAAFAGVTKEESAALLSSNVLQQVTAP